MDQSNQKNLTCSRCGFEIGNRVIIDGEELIQLGGLVLREAHGVCAKCGRAYHYSVSERMLRSLVERVKERKAEEIQ